MDTVTLIHSGRGFTPIYLVFSFYHTSFCLLYPQQIMWIPSHILKKVGETVKKNPSSLTISSTQAEDVLNQYGEK